jgi:hypothetical protein
LTLRARITPIVLAAAAACLPVRALALDGPKGDVILTVTGNGLEHANAGGDAVFDLPMLESLAGRSAQMETPWTEGRVRFSGPFLRSVLAAAGAHATRIRVTALNDYSADVPVEDAAKLDTMLATRMNGDLMSVRDKGPLFLVYPFDQNADLMNEKYFSRSVWQIRTIEVIE